MTTSPKNFVAVCAETRVLTDKGYVSVGSLVGAPVTVWTGKQWAGDVVFTKTIENAPVVRVTMSNGKYIRCDPSNEFSTACGIAPRNPLDVLGLDSNFVTKYERFAAATLAPGCQLEVAPPDGHLEEFPTHRVWMNGVLVTEPAVKVLAVKPDGFEDMYCADVKELMAEGVIIS